MTPSHSTRPGKRYRYCVSPAGPSVAAGHTGAENEQRRQRSAGCEARGAGCGSTGREATHLLRSRQIHRGDCGRQRPPPDATRQAGRAVLSRARHRHRDRHRGRATAGLGRSTRTAWVFLISRCSLDFARRDATDSVPLLPAGWGGLWLQVRSLHHRSPAELRHSWRQLPRWDIQTWFSRTAWCGREDSNFHGLSPTTTSTLRVYQFRHDR